MKKVNIILKQKKTFNFFYSLINSDFLLLDNSSVSKKNNRFLKSNLKLLNNKEFFLLLNYSETIKTLKQFIRILQFFKNTKNPLLLLDIKNRQFSKIIDLYINNNKDILPLKFNNNTLNIDKDFSSFILLLENSFLNEKNLFKKLIYSKIFTIIKINSIIEKNNFSSYKIFNSLKILKKFIFLLVLLKKVYTRK